MAGGPGGHESERISIKVVPDTSGFAEKLKAFLEKVEKNNKVELEVELDTKKAEAELKRLAKDLTVELKVDVDSKGVREELERLGRNVHAKVKTDVDDLKAKAELDLLARDRKVNIKADVDKGLFGRITSSLGSLGSVLSGIGKGAFQFITGGLDGMTDSIGTATSGFSKMGSVMQVIGTIATAVFYGVIIAALAGIVIAAGAVAGALALAFAPAVFIAAGVAFALLSKKGGGLAASLRKNFESVKKTALSVVTDAVQPMLGALNAQIPAIKAWISSIRGPLKSAFTSSAKFVSTFRLGMQDFISNTLTGVVGALNNPGLKPAVKGVRTLLADMGSAIGVFFDTLANFGPGFGKTLEALGEQLVPLTGALAGLLGAFSVVAPDLISRIGTGITQILQAFSNPNTVKGLQLLANISFDTIILSLQTLAGVIAQTSYNWDALKSATSATVSFIKSAWNAMASFLSGLWNSITSVASAAWNRTRSAVSTAASALASAVRSAVSALRSFLSSAWNSISSVASSAFSRIYSFASSKLHAIGSAASSVVSSIKGFFSGLAGYVNGVVSSIRSAVGTIISLASKAAGAISKLNPFGAVYSDDDAPEGPNPRGFGGPPPAGGSMAMGSFQGDLNSMQSSANKLRNSMLGNVRSLKTGSGGSSSGVAQRVYQFGDIIANNKPTEESIVQALTYADALFAS